MAYLNPCLNFFYFFSKCARARKVWGPTGGRCFCKACMWWPIHIAPQACRFGVWGGMGLKPGPHACLLPPWWLTLGHCTAPGGRTRLGRWLAGPCPPCVANRPSVAHWQNHWGQATEPTMVRACPPSLVCMLHVPCQKLGPRHKAWAGGHSNTWRLVLAHTGPRPIDRFCVTQLCCFGQPFRQQRAASWGPKKFQAFGATWVAYTCPPWLANAPLLPLAMPLASATQTPPDPGGSPASTRCRRHRCRRPQATAWAQRGAKVSHLGGRGCAPGGSYPRGGHTTGALAPNTPGLAKRAFCRCTLVPQRGGFLRHQPTAPTKIPRAAA